MAFLYSLVELLILAVVSLDTLGFIVRNRKQTKLMPIILINISPNTDFLTSDDKGEYANLKNAVECKKQGADDLVSKPYDPADLFTTIERVLLE